MHSYVSGVAISWGNKINFSLCVNMFSFCSDSHILQLHLCTLKDLEYFQIYQQLLCQNFEGTHANFVKAFIL